MLNIKIIIPIKKAIIALTINKLLFFLLVDLEVDVETEKCTEGIVLTDSSINGEIVFAEYFFI
jgi:hypothetical protein